MFCFGHRGARGYEPENTLLGIRKGLELGAAGIEIDIHAVHGALLVHHDASINIDGTTHQLSELSLDKIRSLDVGKGERIPFLSEVLELINGSVLLNIEIKSEAGEHLLVGELKRVFANGYDRTAVLVSSFHHRELKRFHDSMPEVKTGLLLYGVPLDPIAEARACGCSSIHFHLESVSKALVDEVHAAQMLVYVYTVNEAQDIARMRLIGVDGVFSDYPDRV